MKKNYIDRLNDMKELERYAEAMAEEYRTKDDNGKADFTCTEMMSAYNELARAARKMQSALEKRYGRNYERLLDIEYRQMFEIEYR